MPISRTRLNRSALCILIVVALLALTGTASPASAAQPDPVWVVRGAYAHVESTQLGSNTFTTGLSQSYELVTVRGAEGGSPGLTALMSNKAQMRVLLYKRGTAVSTNDELKFLAVSPTWLMRDASGNIVRAKTGAAVIDITNPAVRQWLVSSIAADVPIRGYDGTFLDVLGVYFAPNFYTARPVINGSPLLDSAWGDASIALVREVKAATGKPVIANGFGVQSGNDYRDNAPAADRLIAAADGIQIEHFTRVANQAAGTFRTTAAWKRDISLLTSANRLGKVVLANTRVTPSADAVTLERSLTFAFASFLLGSEGSSVFQFAPGEYSVRVKATVQKLGVRTSSSEPVPGLLVANFSGGAVAANGTTVSQTLTLNSTRVTLLPQQAVILTSP